MVRKYVFLSTITILWGIFYDENIWGQSGKSDKRNCR